MRYPDFMIHLVLGIGTVAIKNGSKVMDTLLQREHTRVDLNWPWNRSQITLSFL